MTSVWMLWATLGVAAAQGAAPVSAAQAPTAEVLVLGTFHMANPGRDVFNTRADDVLARKRQEEIVALVAALKRFKPTKIAVEQSFSDDRTAKRYADYLAGKLELTRNEVDQVGFRLAKELGHKTVHAVDVDGEFAILRVMNFAKAKGRTKELEALDKEIGAVVEAQSAYLASHTILETLLYMNRDEKVAREVGFYYQQAAFGEPWDWSGADFLTEWFRRNMRIYSNIVGLIDGPGERVLVIYGAGHLGWLQQSLGGNPTIRLRKLAEFVQ